MPENPLGTLPGGKKRMMPLPLDDPRWAELEIGDGRSADVPDKLRHLLQNPADVAAFSDLWPDMCSQDTAWSVSYAAVPYIVEIASRLGPAERWEHLSFVGYVVRCLSYGDAANLPVPEKWTGNRELTRHAYLKDAYVAALLRALPLTLETLAAPLAPDITRYLLGTVAALKGYPNLGTAIENLNMIMEELRPLETGWAEIEG